MSIDSRISQDRAIAFDVINLNIPWSIFTRLAYGGGQGVTDIILVRPGVLHMSCHAQACIYKITKCPLPQDVSSERPCPDGTCVFTRETVERLLYV